ncbi:MAG: branched-chain amino acid aminotransferase [Rickettsiales bacterium]|nr:MAG: branched-chain amino acid aminotransferase [Rickettsiales bacterium]
MVGMDQRDGYIWLNGEFIEWKEAKVHVLTHTLHYASSVFEGERAYNGKVFKAKEHQERLLNSCKIMDLKLDYTVEQINDIIYKTIEKNNLKSCYVRPLVFKGSEGLGVNTEGKNSTQFLIATWEWPALFGDNIDKGLKLAWAGYRKPDPATEPVAAKAAGLYMISMIEENKAIRAGKDDALFLDFRGYLAECGSSNFFLVMNGNELHTPTTISSLNGITRQTVIQLAKEKGLKVYVRDIRPEEIENADEAFITGTAAEVMPVGEVGTKQFKIGKVTLDLRKEYLELTRK